MVTSRQSGTAYSFGTRSSGFVPEPWVCRRRPRMASEVGQVSREGREQGRPHVFPHFSQVSGTGAILPIRALLNFSLGKKCSFAPKFQSNFGTHCLGETGFHSRLPGSWSETRGSWWQVMSGGMLPSAGRRGEVPRGGPAPGTGAERRVEQGPARGRGGVAGEALRLSALERERGASVMVDGDAHIPIPGTAAVSPHVVETESDPGPSRQAQCLHKGHHGGEGAGSLGRRPRSHGTAPGSRAGQGPETVPGASGRSCPADALDVAQWAWFGLRPPDL